MKLQITPKAEIIASVIAYSFCSGSLVLVNKLILHHLNFPSLVITTQLFSALILIYGANLCGALEIDELRMEFLKPYLIYNVAFSLGVYTNMRSLSTSNVETVIVFRALAPLVVSFFDALFLGRELPSRRSLFALITISVGAVGYASTDEEFQSQGWTAYAWPFLYLGLISFEMVYGKKIVKDVQFQTRSGPVQYTNLLGWPPMLLFAKMAGEFQQFHDLVRGGVDGSGTRTFPEFFDSLPFETYVLLILGCIIGTGIGYSSWWCRDKVSATSFTLIGVMNKCLTVLVNLMIWDNHASPEGIAYLLLCIVGGAMYQQAPMRKSDKKAGDEDAGGADGEEDEEMSPFLNAEEDVNGAVFLGKKNASASINIKNHTAQLRVAAAVSTNAE